MRCPVCRADNDTPTCRRCRADLTLLVALEHRRERLLGLAHCHLVQAQTETGMDYARAAQRLRGGEDAAELIALGHFLRREFAAACRLRPRGTTDAGRANPDAVS